MKDRKLTPEQGALESLLKETGLPINRGRFGYSPIEQPLTKYPVLAVWHESELPTQEELRTLEEIAQEKIARYNSQYTHGFYAEGAVMITVKKQNDQWTFNLMTWRQGPLWHPEPTSLTELRNKI